MSRIDIRTARRVRPALAAFAGVLAAVTLSTAAHAADIVVTNDGREFVGEIIEQRADAIVIRTTVAGIDTTLTLARSEIASILRDQEVEDPGDVEDETPVIRGTADQDREETFGVRRVERREGVPALYVVPWHGQTGTDINAEVYRRMIEDIKAADPDYIVIEVDCEDYELGYFTELFPAEQGYTDINALDDYRRILDLFHDDLREYEQVVWIKQAIGMASTLVLAWDTIYMKPDANLEGAEKAAVNFDRVKADADMFGKFREAYMGLIRGFALRSGRGSGYHYIVDSMILPEATLSATWKGREVQWELGTGGEYDIDRSTERVAKFTARTAENFGISSGTAENLDDVALLLGLREYDVIDANSRAIFDGYVEDWRKTLERAEQLAEDYQKHMSWAQGEDYITYFGRAIRDLEGILRCIRQYDAVRIRAAQQYGIQEQQIELQIKIMKEQLAAARRGNRGATGRGGRQAPGGGGGGVNPGG
jgi:hypothetical protein